jgi:hypothetical protein
MTVRGDQPNALAELRGGDPGVKEVRLWGAPRETNAGVEMAIAWRARAKVLQVIGRVELLAGHFDQAERQLAEALALVEPIASDGTRVTLFCTDLSRLASARSARAGGALRPSLARALHRGARRRTPDVADGGEQPRRNARELGYYITRPGERRFMASSRKYT